MTKNTTDTEQRVSAIESHLRRIEAQLADIREVVSSGYEVLSAANERRAQAITAIADRVEYLYESLGPVFFEVFPEQRAFLEEIDRLIGGDTRS